MRRWPIALAFLVPIGAAAAAADAAEEEPDAARELAQVVERLNALDTWLDQAGQRLAGRQKALQSADRRVAAAAGRIRDLGGRIGAAEAALDELGEEKTKLAEEREQHTQRVAEHARAAWRLAGDDVAKLILNQQDPAAVERVLRYHAHLADARAAAADALVETLADLDRNAAERRREAESLRRARSDLAAGQRVLVAERDRQRQAVAGLEADVDAKRHERERLLASRQRLQQLVDALAARKLPGPSGAGLGQAGRLPWPVEEFRGYAKRGGQAFVSTHSPEFLNGAELNEVFVLRKVDGFAQVKRVSDSDLLAHLGEEGDLPGALWRQRLFDAPDL